MSRSSENRYAMMEQAAYAFGQQPAVSVATAQHVEPVAGALPMYKLGRVIVLGSLSICRSCNSNYNLNDMVAQNIKSSDYFLALAEIQTHLELIDEIYTSVSYVGTYVSVLHFSLNHV